MEFVAAVVEDMVGIVMMRTLPRSFGDGEASGVRLLGRLRSDVCPCLRISRLVMRVWKVSGNESVRT